MCPNGCSQCIDPLLSTTTFTQPNCYSTGYAPQPRRSRAVAASTAAYEPKGFAFMKLPAVVVHAQQQPCAATTARRRPAAREAAGLCQQRRWRGDALQALHLGTLLFTFLAAAASLPLRALQRALPLPATLCVQRSRSGARLLLTQQLASLRRVLSHARRGLPLLALLMLALCCAPVAADTCGCWYCSCGANMECNSAITVHCFCNAGYYYVNGRCTQCAQGYYLGEWSSDTEDPTPTKCTMCPVGSTTAATGSDAISDCVLQPGYYIAAAAASTPVLCPANNYCPGGGVVGVVSASGTAVRPKSTGINACSTNSTALAGSDQLSDCQACPVPPPANAIYTAGMGCTLTYAGAPSGNYSAFPSCAAAANRAACYALADLYFATQLNAPAWAVAMNAPGLTPDSGWAFSAMNYCAWEGVGCVKATTGVSCASDTVPGCVLSSLCVPCCSANA